MSHSEIVPVVVTLQDDAMSRIDEVAEDLKTCGMAVENILHAAGAVTGSIARASMASLAAVPGIEDVEEVREVRTLKTAV